MFMNQMMTPYHMNPTMMMRAGRPSAPAYDQETFNKFTDYAQWAGRKVHDAFSPPYSWMMQAGMDVYGLKHPWVFDYWNTPQQLAQTAGYLMEPSAEEKKAMRENGQDPDSSPVKAAFNAGGAYLTGGDPINAFLGSLKDGDPLKMMLGMASGRESMNPMQMLPTLLGMGGSGSAGAGGGSADGGLDPLKMLMSVAGGGGAGGLDPIKMLMNAAAPAPPTSSSSKSGGLDPIKMLMNAAAPSSSSSSKSADPISALMGSLLPHAPKPQATKNTNAAASTAARADTNNAEGNTKQATLVDADTATNVGASNTSITNTPSAANNATVIDGRNSATNDLNSTIINDSNNATAVDANLINTDANNVDANNATDVTTNNATVATVNNATAVDANLINADANNATVVTTNNATLLGSGKETAADASNAANTATDAKTNNAPPSSSSPQTDTTSATAHASLPSGGKTQGRSSDSHAATPDPLAMMMKGLLSAATGGDSKADDGLDPMMSLLKNVLAPPSSSSAQEGTSKSNGVGGSPDPMLALLKGLGSLAAPLSA